ncbi:MAG: hypothetical protein ACI8P9_001060 [Parasphingorhabdus sp.]|jgi:hypothetical protein
MKIRSVETFLTDPSRETVNGKGVKPFLFVCLKTTDGLTGWMGGSPYPASSRTQHRGNFAVIGWQNNAAR